MKKLFFLLPFSILMLLSSCSMEKRLYRNGFYYERPKKIENASSNFTSDDAGKIDSNSFIAPSKIACLAQAPNFTKDSKIVLTSLAKISKVVLKHNSSPRHLLDKFKSASTRGLPNPNRMTYAQARTQMAEKGCTPNALANTAYYLSRASATLAWLGIGFLLVPVALIVATLAKQDVIRNKSCLEENFAIIDNAKRICYWLLIGLAITLLLALLLGGTFFSGLGLIII